MSPHTIRAAPRIPFAAAAAAAVLLTLMFSAGFGGIARAQVASSTNTMGNPGNSITNPELTNPNFGTMPAPVGTSTASSTTIAELQSRVSILESQVATLQLLIVQLMTNQGMNSGSTTASTTTPGIPNTGTMGSTTGTSTNSGVQSGWIDQNNGSTKAGTSLDFGGHGFGSEEHVQIWLNGVQVGTAFTNLGGGFSTGSMSIPATPGTYTWRFIGEKSGIMGTATVTLTQ